MYIGALHQSQYRLVNETKHSISLESSFRTPIFSGSGPGCPPLRNSLEVNRYKLFFIHESVQENYLCLPFGLGEKSMYDSGGSSSAMERREGAMAG